MITKLRIAVWVSVLCAITACPAPESPPPPVAVTDVGEPTGAPVTQMVGASGATLRTADNKLELVIPAGALAADTSISITPISAKAPGAVAGWRLGPEGTTFAQAVTLKITPSAADLAGSSLEAMQIAYQREDKKWMELETTVDGSAVKVNTTHFSDWNALAGMRFVPGEATIKLGADQRFQIRFCFIDDTGVKPPEQGLVRECEVPQIVSEESLTKWSLNGIEFPPTELGTINDLNREPTAIYYAPNAPPPSNPVALSVTYTSKLTKKTVIVANITVETPAYQGSLSFVTQASNYRLTVDAPTMRWVEHGSSAKNYKASGNFTYTYNQTNCDPLSSSGTFEDGDLTIYPAGSPAFANTYNMVASAAPMVRASCGMPRMPIDIQVPIIFQVGFCTGSETMPYTDVRHLTGSGPCASQKIESSTWDFTLAP